MSAITTHILDTSRGRPAGGVEGILEVTTGEIRREVGRGFTDADGRLRTLMPADLPLARGVYRITFLTGPYFEAQEIEGFYPQVVIDFEIREPSQHYHVPLLLNPFGFSTYRGS